MADALSEHSAGPEAQTLQPSPMIALPQAPGARRQAERDGAQTIFRQAAAAGGGQEPPPEQFSSLLGHPEYSHPVNNGQKARVLLSMQGQYGNHYVQRVLAQSRSPRAGAEVYDPARKTDGLMIQRAPDNASSGSTPAAPVSGTATGARPATTPARAMIVDDSVVDTQPGQMKKSAFLSELREAVCLTVQDALSGTPWSAVGCPYIDAWFNHYRDRDAQYVERAVQRYASVVASGASARDYIPAITARVREGVSTWATTGEVSGVPEGLRGVGLPGAGELNVGSQAGAAPSVSGPVGPSFKERAGGAKALDDPLTIQSQLSGGRSLEGGTRSSMESVFGQDFSQVRVHTGAKAAELSSRMNARAFTVGQDIAFGAGEYQPGTLIGDALVAHELSHVVQQSGADVTAPLHKGDGDNNSLEEAADTAAASAIVSIWGSAKAAVSKIGRNIMPSLKSGLRLQRCPVVAGIGAVGAGGYVLLRPNVANAPGPGDPTYPSVSNTQVAGEAVALFGIPGGLGAAMKGARYSIIAIGAAEGATAAVGYRGVQDISAGSFSGVEAYVVDATTGGLLGVVVSGVFSWVRSPKSSMGAPGTLHHHTNALDEIAASGEVWARTEGRVYATELAELTTGWQQFRMGLRSQPTGTVGFRGQPAEMFQPHPIEGWYSGAKNAAGQYVSRQVGYDIVFVPAQATRTGSLLQITQAEWARQSAARYFFSHARLWGRRVFIDWGIPAVGGGGMLSGGALSNYPTGSPQMAEPPAISFGDQPPDPAASAAETTGGMTIGQLTLIDDLGQDPLAEGGFVGGMCRPPIVTLGGGSPGAVAGGREPAVIYVVPDTFGGQ